MEPRAEAGSGRTYGGLCSSERKDRRREAFIAAGLQVFGSSGFRSATVRGLCQEAGLATRYFYESFVDMEALLAAVFETCVADFRRRVAATFEAPEITTDPEAMIQAGLECFFGWAEDARVARVCWREVVGVSRALDTLSRKSLQSFAPTLLELTRAVYPDWKVDDAEAQVVAVAATGALSQAALRWHQDKRRLPRATMVAATARILRGIRLTIEADLAASRDAKRSTTRR